MSINLVRRVHPATAGDANRFIAGPRDFVLDGYSKSDTAQVASKVVQRVVASSHLASGHWLDGAGGALSQRSLAPG